MRLSYTSSLNLGANADGADWFGRIDSLRLADKLGGSVEDDHRAKSIGLEPTTYGVSRFGCYQLTYEITRAE